MRIAVDAVGGDHGSAVVVAGALDGARRFGVALALCGPAAELRRAVDTLDHGGVDLEIVDAPDVIGMDEQPAQAVRRKPRSSIGVALGLLRDGGAGGMVSAGNSGAVMAAALLLLGRARGVDRPAIAAFMPAGRGQTFVLDLGAVADPRPHHLVQFAQMGSLYVAHVGGAPRPTVGLLSNGEEASKGNALVREVFPLLAAARGIEFRGNVEGKDIPRGVVDIVVTDGFTGNVALKIAEGVASLVADTVAAEVTATPWRKLAALALRPAFRNVRTRLDYAETGGALLLGVDGTVVVAHGRSNPRAIAGAIGVAMRGAAADVPGEIGRLLPNLAIPSGVPTAGSAAAPVPDAAVAP